MATIFGGSRLANLREKRTSGDELIFKKEEQPRLELPSEQSDKNSYEPSSLSNPNRIQTRLLKGRIQRPTAQTQNYRPQYETQHETNELSSRPKLTLPPASEQLKLVINDEIMHKQDSKGLSQHNPLRNTQRRILIAKQPEKQQIQVKAVEQPRVQPLVQAPQPEPQKHEVFDDNKPIRQEEVQESMPGENDLVECPQGCGRKFNRKALDKHAKACKLVFMSKRKQFNSEAKRIVTKQQAKIVKESKAKEKKEGKGKGKGFDKTSDNWKTASEDFRAAVKAIKKEVGEEKDEEIQKQQAEQEMKISPCSFCDKPFAQIFLEKHLDVCVKKKQTEKKKTFKKK